MVGRQDVAAWNKVLIQSSLCACIIIATWSKKNPLNHNVTNFLWSEDDCLLGCCSV
jgi:hypothetical protein